MFVVGVCVFVLFTQWQYVFHFIYCHSSEVRSATALTLWQPEKVELCVIVERNHEICTLFFIAKQIN